MIFPEGIEYDRKTDQYRTLRVNSFFSYIPVITKDVDNKKTRKFRVKTKNSGLVPGVGIEPTLQRNWILNPARLPIPPLEQMIGKYVLLKLEGKSRK